MYNKMNLQNENVLEIGYKEDSGTGTVTFEGFSPENGGAIYLAFNGSMIPLSNMSMNIGSPLTDTAGRFPAQLVEVIDGELVRHSKRFTVIVRDSVPTGDAKEITTPALDLVYAEVKRKLEALENIDTENLVSKETVAEAVNEAVQASLSDYCTVEATDAKIASEAKIRANSNEAITDALSKKQDSGDYVTADALASKGYITDEALKAEGFVTDKALTSKGYITGEELTGKGYITDETLTGKGYVTETDMTGRGYITETALNSKGYITETDIDGKGYQTAAQVTAAIKAALAEYEDGNTTAY